GCQPAVVISDCNDSRTETSSSTMKTTELTSGIATTSIAPTADDEFTVYDLRAAVPVDTSSSYLSHPKCGVESVEQGRFAQRLEQALDGPCREQARADRLIVSRCDEHNRDDLPATDQFLLQFGARHAAHRDVEQQAVGLAENIGREERFGRRERFNRKPELP